MSQLSNYEQFQAAQVELKRSYAEADNERARRVAAQEAISVEYIPAIEAGWRLANHSYYDWSLAGGENECRHGIARGIPCERCDKITLDLAFDKIQRARMNPMLKPSRDYRKEYE